MNCLNDQVRLHKHVRTKLRFARDAKQWTLRVDDLNLGMNAWASNLFFTLDLGGRDEKSPGSRQLRGWDWT